MAHGPNHDRDLDDWLDGLHGRPRPGAAPSTVTEASAQRDAIAARHAARPVEAQDPSELQRLLFRLRREGLLGESTEAASTQTRWRLPLAAAAVLALGLAVTILGPGLWQTGEEPVLRSGAAEQLLEVPGAEVAATAQRLQTALQTLGVAVRVADTGGGAIEVAATVPKDKLSAAANVLARFGLKPPAADGTLRVEVRPRG
jgi:hypothetical protein